MFIEKLDRHQWTLKEAKEHIAKLIRAQLEREQKAIAILLVIRRRLKVRAT